MTVDTKSQEAAGAAVRSWRPAIRAGARLGAAAIFVLAGAGKVLLPMEQGWRGWALLLLSILEIVAGLLMIMNLRLSWCAWLGLAIAVGGILWSAFTGSSCGCFGPAMLLDKTQHQVVAAALGLMCWVVLRQMPAQPSSHAGEN